MKNNNNAELKLILQSQLSGASLEDCYMEGYAASRQDHDEDVNPYQSHTKAAQFWQDGYGDYLSGYAPLFPDHSFEPMEEQPSNGQEVARADQRRKQGLSPFEYVLYSAGAIIAGISVYSALLDLAAA